MLSTIRTMQTAMRQTLRDAEAILIRAGDLEVLELGTIRSGLAVQLKAYTDFKHRTVFPTLLGSPDPVAAKLAAMMRARCDAMGDLYRRHIADWPMLRVVEERSRFRSAALDVIGRLRQHFLREEADIVRLTERPLPVPSTMIAVGARTGF